MREVAKELSVPLIEVCRAANYIQGPFGPAEGKTPDHGLHGHGMSRSQCGPLVEWCSSQFRMEASDTSADRLFTVER